MGEHSCPPRIQSLCGDRGWKSLPGSQSVAVIGIGGERACARRRVQDLIARTACKGNHPTTSGDPGDDRQASNLGDLLREVLFEMLASDAFARVTRRCMASCPSIWASNSSCDLPPCESRSRSIWFNNARRQTHTVLVTGADTSPLSRNRGGFFTGGSESRHFE